MKWIFPIFLCLAQFSWAQWADTFNDGNFIESPQWVGQPEKFIVNANNQLQLKAPATASEAWLFTASDATENAAWTFDVMMQFDPSSQNYARVYLMSDSNDPLLVQNGFFVMMGGTEDEVSLYQIKNGSSIKVIDGANGRLTASTVNVSIKATYNNVDGWLLQTYINNTWQTEGSSNVRPYQTSTWFGVYCRYSSTRSDKFLFDNFAVTGTVIQDVDTPSVTKVEAIRGNALAVTFSEALDGNTVVAQSFLLNPFGASPSFIETLSPNRLVLHFTEQLADGSIGLMRFSGLTDLAGNVLPDTSVVFAYHQFKCMALSAITNRCVKLTFNKDLMDDDGSPLQFVLSPNNVTSVSVDVIDARTVLVFFADAFENKSDYAINMIGLTDINKDPLLNPSIQFNYFIPERHDLVFTELMADPEPSNSLPVAEFIEIYNRSSVAIDLSGFYILMSGKKYLIESAIIGANGYACLVAQNDGGLWADYPNIVQLKSFPALPNSAGSLVLLSPDNRVLDVVNYDEGWQMGSFKDNGGWSFERKDLNNFSNVDNWGHSINLNGGTPGMANSIFGNWPDMQAPRLSLLELMDNKSLKLTFSEPIANLASIKSQLSIENGQILKFEPDTVWCQTLVLVFDTLIRGQLYSVRFSQKVNDFAGNGLDDFFPLVFAATEVVGPKDIIINEILFNPRTGEEDFIEIFNGSQKTIKLSDLYLSTMEGDMPQNLVRLSAYDIPLMPGSYFSFSPDPLPYLGKADAPWWFFLNKRMSNFPDTSGDIAILTVNGTVIDRVNYHEDWHFPLLNSKEGVSLERIRSNKSSNDKNNWQSASHQKGYCTPTGANSQSIELSDGFVDESFKLASEIFTPDGDGNNDVLLIEVGKGMEGRVATLKVFDASGREVCTLANNELLGNQSQWKWDGTNSTGELMPNGIYIVWINSFDDLGHTIEEKKACVLGAKPH